MKLINAYLGFDGNCREAMDFYKECLGGELMMMPYAAAPVDMSPECQGGGDRIMHARLSKGEALLMASDTPVGANSVQGNNVMLNINCESLEEIERVFVALGEGGKVTVALNDTFWGARFGMLDDRFGIHWMFNYELPKAA